MYVPDIVMYHHPCTDGITSVAIVKHFYDEKGFTSIEYTPANYDNVANLINKCRDKNVLVVDFSFKLEVTNKIMQSANSMVILDHHVSAEKELSEYFVNSNPTLENIENDLKENDVLFYYNVEKSGASLTWSTFFPTIINDYVEKVAKIDLGKVDSEELEYFKYYTRSIPFNIDQHIVNLEEYRTKDSHEQLYEAGKHIKNFVRCRLNELEKITRTGKIVGIEYPFVITDYLLASDYANTMLSDKCNLAIAYYFTNNGIGMSLRSKNDLDCSKIAESFGGGGHKYASGVNISWENLPEFIDVLIEQGTNLFNE